MSEIQPPIDRSDPESRRDWLRQTLQRVGSITIGEAALSLGTSEMTIRRDLATLEVLGQARRVRGGAKSIGPALFDERSPRNARSKAMIAEKTSSLLPSTGTIAIDSSSTMACLANLLASAQDLLVVTNGIETFDSLQSRPGIRVVLTGGERDPHTSSLVGPIAERAAMSFHYDIAFVSAAAIDPTVGALEATLEEAAMKRAFAQRSARVVLGADSSKIGANAPVTGLEWNLIDELVTELAPMNSRLEVLRGSVTLR